MYFFIFFCVAVAPFPVEDNGTAVVHFAVAGSRLQGTAMSKTLHVPEPFSIARYPLLQDRPALCSCCHRSTHCGATASGELHYRYHSCKPVLNSIQFITLQKKKKKMKMAIYFSPLWLTVGVLEDFMGTHFLVADNWSH